MYPGGNNYNQNNPNQQPGFNVNLPSYGSSTGFPTNPCGPPIGFNVDMNQAPGYGPPQPGMYGGYDQYPSNSQPYMHSAQGYPATQPSYAPQGQYMPGQSGPQYQQSQYPQASMHGQQPSPQCPPSQYPQTSMHGQQPSPHCPPSQYPQGSMYGQQPSPQCPPSQYPQASIHGQQPSPHCPPSQYPQGSMQGQQPSPNYQQSQYPQANTQNYNNANPSIYDHQKPLNNQGQPQNTSQYGQTNSQINQQQQPPHNPAFSSNMPTANYSTHTNQQTNVDCIGSSGEILRGTIKPYPNFNVEQDCNILKKAMKGLGTDEKAIIECLGRRNHSQRLEIKKMFKTMFGKDLIEELKSELSGNFSRAVIESLYDSDYYDAYSLYKAMEGAGTREDVLTEILTSRSNQQIVNIKDIYKKLYNKNLEKDVISETSGFYKRVLVSCLQANKKELTGDEMIRLRQQGPGAVINANMARQEAQELFNAGENKIGTDEACFIKIFATRNKYQLKATFDEYQRIASRDIITSIEREMSGDLAASLKAMAMQAINPALYFSTRLYNAIKGAGTNDTALIRILLTRSEIDMENIKIEFQRQFHKSLDSYVRGDTSGDYMKFLLRFVDGN